MRSGFTALSPFRPLTPQSQLTEGHVFLSGKPSGSVLLFAVMGRLAEKNALLSNPAAELCSLYFGGLDKKFMNNNAPNAK